MKTSIIGILNAVPERVQNVKSIVRRLPSYARITIVTRTPEEFSSFPNVKTVTLEGELDGNISRCKNVFLREALETRAEFCYIMEDNFCFDTWKNLVNYQYPLKKLDYPFAAFGGYQSKGRNMALRKLPNPALRLKLGRDTFVFNRVINTSLVVHKMEENTPLYDEKVGLVEFEEYSLRLKESGRIPMYTLYLDANGAWDLFSETDTKVYRTKNKEMYDADGKYVGARIHPEPSFDPLIKYCVKQAVEKGLIPHV